VFYKANIELHFHGDRSGEELISIKMTSNMHNSPVKNTLNLPEGNDEYFCDLFMYACFANRLMINFGMNDPNAHLVAEQLEKIAEDIYATDCVFRYEGAIKEYDGEEGKQRFIIGFEWGDDRTKLDLKMKGFPFFGTTIVQHSLDAVDALAKYLDNKHGRDPVFSKFLKRCAAGCAVLTGRRMISMTNQQNMALSVVTNAFADLCNT